MSKTAYVLLEKWFHYDDSHYPESTGGEFFECFDTLDDAKVAQRVLDLEVISELREEKLPKNLDYGTHVGRYLGKTEHALDNDELFKSTLRVISGRDVEYIRNFDFRENLTDTELIQFLDTVDFSFYILQEVRVTEANSKDKLSDWHFVMELHRDITGECVGEVVGAYPFREVAERVVEGWWAANRKRTIGEMVSERWEKQTGRGRTHIEVDRWDLESLREILGDESFELPRDASSVGLEQYTREEMVAILCVLGANYLEVVKQ